ncbi:MAG: helix-turn-helix domain-containing protein, partial [Patescibacteria group bacterium]
MLQELQEFGLSEKEARVYLAALELGKATADELAKQAKVNRSTTYVQIESLKQKGLVSSYDEGKKTYFAPESPEYLKRLFEKQAGDLDVKQKELEKENRALHDQFEASKPSPQELLPVKIIGRNNDQLVIDKGSKEGVISGNIVVY